MAVLFALSSRTLPPRAAVFPDWATHGGAYAALCVLCCRALAGGLGAALRRGDALLAVVFSVVYGMSDEYHQSFVPGRDATAWDVAKDAVGALVGAWLYARVIVPRFRLQQHGEALQHREAHRG
jgi:VanZ family protein